MNKKWVRWISTMMISVMLTGCQEAVVPQEINENTNQQEEPTKPISEGEKIRDLFLSKLQTGMKEEEVRDLFGGDFRLVENAMEGTETWRYDLGKQKEYAFDDQGIDRVDIKGLKSKKVQALLFIDWTSEGTVNSAALFLHKPDNDDTFLEYHMDSEGVEEVIQTYN